MRKVKFVIALDQCARQMPALRHRTCEPFDITESEAAAWLCSQPDVMDAVFDKAKQKGFIVFDPATRTWRGVDHEA